MSSAIAGLFREVESCRQCKDELDPSKAVRLLAGSPERASLFIVGQALAEKTQRVTGVPFFGPDGTLAATGKQLERFLNLVGATLHPERAIALPGGRIEAALPGLAQVFCSEIVHCFPGKSESGKGDRFTSRFAERCLAQGFLEREMALVDPRIVITLGAQAGRFFWKHFGDGTPPYDSVTAAVRHVSRTGQPYALTVAGRERFVVPLIHPSGLARGFKSEVLKNEKLVTAIRANLGGQP